MTYLFFILLVMLVSKHTASEESSTGNKTATNLLNGLSDTTGIKKSDFERTSSFFLISSSWYHSFFSSPWLGCC